jgi:hypothetical protein
VSSSTPASAPAKGLSRGSTCGDQTRGGGGKVFSGGAHAAERRHREWPERRSSVGQRHGG